LACWQEKTLVTAFKNYEKKILKWNHFREKIQKVQSKKWILDIDDQDHSYYKAIGTNLSDDKSFIFLDQPLLSLSGFTNPF
jgi:glycosylphosphatidylinositol transamidase (GPIT) subunit GPI8